MSWNPNQGQDPNQPSQYGAYNPNMQPPPAQGTDPYSGPQGGYGPQQSGGPGQYGQAGGYQPGGYQQGGYDQQGAYQQYGQQQGGYQQPYGAPPMGSASPLGTTSMGMDPKTASGLSYLGVWITGLIFFFMEKQNRFVRFHAMQSILFFGGISVLSFILRIAVGFSPDFLALGLGCLSAIIGLVGFIGWIVLMINGFQGKYFKL